MMTVVSLTVEVSSARTKLGTEMSTGTQPKTETSQQLPSEKAVAEPTVPQQRPSPLPAEPPTIPVVPVTPIKVSTPEPPVRQPARTHESLDSPIRAQRTPEVSVASEPTLQTPSPSSASSAGGALDDAEQKQHNDARRFARLLVSEIKLYNEQRVLEGRQEKNLYGLLRDDIDKSREMYEKRASPNVSAKVDYFYDELVRILADNHAEALGKDCPGPVLLTR